MQYNKFGSTGEKISALGFGAMRLPTIEKDGKHIINRDEAIKMFHTAFDAGVNYIDTAYFYHDGESECVVGEGLKGYRDSVMLSTKYPVNDKSQSGHYTQRLHEQLKKLDTQYIDFYHFHGINKGCFDNLIVKNGLLKEALKAKEEGLIKHISFSFHDKPENMRKIIDEAEIMETVLCQYNLLDRSNEDGIAYAKSKGMGVVAMGPVAGGRLGVPSQTISSMLGKDFVSTPEMALRFVLANKNIDCALSGMSNMQMVLDNIKVAEIETPLSVAESEQVKKMLEENKRLAELYCTGCNYCLPCPKSINIPHIFRIMNNHRVYGLTDLAKKQFSSVGKNERDGANPSECVDCGLCEKKCPQHIEIRKQLKDTINALS